MKYSTSHGQLASPMPHGDLLIGRGITWRRLAPALACTLALPRDNVFLGTLPDASDYGILLDQGYLVVSHLAPGTFEWIAQGMLQPNILSDQALQDLSASLDVPICVDRSESDLQPDYDVYTPLFIHRGVPVKTHEDREGNPVISSETVEEIIKKGGDKETKQSAGCGPNTTPDRAG